MLTIYNGAIRPAMTYGAEIWANKLTQKQRNKINSVQKTALIGATTAYKTTSTEALQILANSYPLDIYVEALNRANERTNMSKKEAKQIEEEELKREWEKRWRTTKNRDITRKFIRINDIRNEIKIKYKAKLIEILTGHGNFNKYIHKIGKAETPNCETNEEIDNVEH